MGPSSPPSRKEPRISHLEDYAPLLGREQIDRIREKAKALRHLHVAHVNSTLYGGRVAELLDSLTLLMNDVGITTGWCVIQGGNFFSITKKMVNALQRRSAVVLQKSLCEGFGLTVTEAMRKGTPVIGGNVGGHSPPD